MILKSKEFREACRQILFAIDNKEASLFTETLELKTEGTTLSMNVTNREYYVTVKFNLDEEGTFEASVNAATFLRLIDKLTTDTIELTTESNCVKIKANGDYKIPLVYEPTGGSILKLPKIDIENITNTMDINSSILNSITTYNSKELTRGVSSNPVSKYYYIDELGALTFTSGACVNSFTLPKAVKMLLNDKVVKLFKLFKEDQKVTFTMGQDPVTDELVQTKVRFEVKDVILTAKLSDMSLISSVKSSAIRDMANKAFDYNITVGRDALYSALQRITLLGNDKAGFMEFDNSNITIYDSSKNNKEVVKISNNCEALESYSLAINLISLSNVINDSSSEYVNLSFGDGKAVVIKKNNISDLIPESRVR